MKLGVTFRKKQTVSLRLYRDFVLAELEKMGIEWEFIHSAKNFNKEIDVVWHPSGPLSSPFDLTKLPVPVVMTIHGVIPLKLKWYQQFRGILGNAWRAYEKHRFFSHWKKLKTKISAIISVSNYAKQEVLDVLDIVKEKVIPIYHGVDLNRFNTGKSNINNSKPYFFHVSSFQPKKNVTRIIQAYDLLPRESRPELIMVLPGFKQKISNIAGLKILREEIPHQKVAEYLRGAMGFIFPSLHETFGMPITEAMACGCPVITSNITACPEVAADSALLVNPYSVEEITDAMQRLYTNEDLRKDISTRGILRAKEFSWEKSAEKHLEVFEKIIAQQSS